MCDIWGMRIQIQNECVSFALEHVISYFAGV